ncbi:hypothetical protein G6F31_021686 [Rhizopus arrhizus]|nr:hypothetical protein G6F31_021686 [Rhizopus arrhizus]
MLIETASLSGAIMLIVGCATAMAWALTQSGFSGDLARLMAGMPGGSYGFLAVHSRHRAVRAVAVPDRGAGRRA